MNGSKSTCMTELIYVVGEAHPEELFASAINRIDDNLPTEAQLKEWDLSNLISVLSSYQTMMNKYFYRVEEGGKKYLDGSKEIVFDEQMERTFWEEMFGVFNGIYPLNPSEVDKAMEKLEKSRKMSSQKRDLIRKINPDVIYHEGIGMKNGKKLEYGLYSVVPVVANDIGARLVYLDEGFEPYTDPTFNRWASQDGREQHWTERVVGNAPRKSGLLFVGDDHLMGKRPGIPYIGEFLDLLDGRGINYHVLERSARQN